MMKRISLYLIIYTMLSALAACDRRELTYDYHPFCDVQVEVDWSRFSEMPTGMTVIFYPESGEKAVTHTTNSVHHTTVSLREGKYNVLLFNQSPGEFGSLGFRGLERYETAEVFAQEAASKGWYSKAETEKVAAHPERFAVATLEGFVVTEDMVDAYRKEREQGRTISRATVTLTPRDIIADGVVIVHVKGIYNMRSVRGSISGMAEHFLPSAFQTGTDEVTHLLESWKVDRDADNYANGTITTQYTSFGMPGMKLSRAGENTWKNAYLNISVLLVDNKTVKDYSFFVGNHIELSEETGRITLNLELEKNEEGEFPIALPDVKPEGGSGSGFNATVDDWGDDVNVEVEL